MAQLFDVSTDNVGLHLKNIFEDGELSREATTEESSVVQTEGGREVQRPITLYNLDAILAVGYRVRSPRGVNMNPGFQPFVSAGHQTPRALPWAGMAPGLWPSESDTPPSAKKARLHTSLGQRPRKGDHKPHEG